MPSVAFLYFSVIMLNVVMLSVIMPSVAFLYFSVIMLNVVMPDQCYYAKCRIFYNAKCSYAQCYYAKCRIFIL